MMKFKIGGGKKRPFSETHKKKALLTLFVLFFFGVGVVMAQTQVRGTVMDEYGEPVIGATVQIRGTSQGTVTDFDGNFTLSAPANGVLVVSYVGYRTQEVPVSSNVNIELVPDSEMLDEIVVTALGIRRDSRALGYAVSTVRGEDLLRAGLTTSPFSALYGKAAGVGIQATAGGPMGGINIKVRGAQGLESSSNSRPLFVIDGVPMYDTESSMASRGYDPLNSFDYGSAVNDINAEDIASIEILKGAKASILYGSQGANGVVLITTKSGAGTRGLGVSITYGLETEVPFTYMKFQNEFGSGTNAFSRSQDPDGQRRVVSSRYSFGPAFDGSPIKFFDGRIMPYEAQKNNYMDLFRNGSTQTVSAAISGGNERGSMRLSVTNFDYNGTMQNQEMTRNTLSFNGQMRVSNFAKFEFIQNFFQTRTQNRRPNLQQLVAWGTFNRDYDISAAKEMYKDENGFMTALSGLGNIDGGGWGWPEAFVSRNGGLFQMLWNNNENRNIDKRIQSNTSAIADLQFLPYLNFRWQSAINYNDTDFIRRNKVMGKDETTGAYQGGQFRFSRDRNVIQRHQGTLSFDDEISSDLQLTAFIGGAYQRTDFTSVGVGTFGNFKFPDFWSLSNGDGWPAQYDDRVASYSAEGEAIYSVLGQAMLSYKDTYYFEFQAANDWASTLPAANRSYFYPGASFTWIFTENFDIPHMDRGRFRLSLADVGRPASRYYALRTYEMSTLPAPNTNINVVNGPEDLFSGDLKPERKREWETGLNVRMFNNRIEADVAYYNNVNYNEIMSVPLSWATGAGQIRINAGRVQRQGIELFLRGTPVQTRAFQLDMRFNLAKQWDQILELYPGITEKVTSTNGVFRVDAEGHRMGNLWLNDYTRDAHGNKVVNASGFYTINTNQPATDRMLAGNIYPNFYGGFNTDFAFRGNWGQAVLSAGLDYTFGGKVLSYTNFYMIGNGLAEETLKYRNLKHGGLEWVETLNDGTTRVRYDGLILPGVKADGTPNDKIIPANEYYSTFINDMSSASWRPESMQDNNYIKFRELSLGYTLPVRASRQLKLEKVTLSLTARNLFYLYKSIKHVDAEAVLGTAGSNQWIENSSYPSSRSYGFRLNVSF
jgi:iron complex outermembrane receptor protein